MMNRLKLHLAPLDQAPNDGILNLTRQQTRKLLRAQMEGAARDLTALCRLDWPSDQIGLFSRVLVDGFEVEIRIKRPE